MLIVFFYSLLHAILHKFPNIFVHDNHAVRRHFDKCYIVTGQSLGSHWAVTGQSLGSHWAVTGQSLGDYHLQRVD